MATYTWDAAGRRIAQGPINDPDDVTYGYDAAGRLSTYADSAAGVAATYAYDARGQRTRMTVTQGSVTTTSTFTYEGLTLLRVDAAASDGATSSVTYLSDGSGRPYGGVYASSETSAVAFGIVTTDRGDVRALTDAGGEPFAFYSFDAYGSPLGTQTRAAGSVEATQAAAIAGANVLRYAGYAYDAHSGLYYCSARYYDPATASFITKDPAKADGEESAYQYCGGDPVGRVDPSGECESKILSVPTVTATMVCWAGAVRAIIRYVRGAWVAESAIVETAFGYVPGTWNQRSRTTKQVQGVLSKYGIQSTRVSGASWYSTVRAEIRANRPLYVRWGLGSTGHAVVIKGFKSDCVTGAKYIYYMDPAKGSQRLKYEDFKQTDGGILEGGWSYSWTWTDTLKGLRR